MVNIAALRHAAPAAALAAAVGMIAACGGHDGSDPIRDAARESQPQAAVRAIQGVRITGRDEALQIVARAVMAPLYCSELAHSALARVFELRAAAHGRVAPASTGDRWELALDSLPPGASTLVEGPGPVGVDIEAADHAEGLMLRGEPGYVRAVLRFEQAPPGAAARMEGAFVLEVSRTAETAAAARRSRADNVSVTAGGKTMRWSYLDVTVDPQQASQTLMVVADVPVNDAGRVWLDTTSVAPGRPIEAPATTPSPSGRYVVNGIIGSLKSRLTLQVAADGGWTIDVDNDKDDRVDFVVRASADEVRALGPGSWGRCRSDGS